MTAEERIKYSQPIGWTEQPITPAAPLALCPRCTAATIHSSFHPSERFCPRCQWNSWSDDAPVSDVVPTTPAATTAAPQHCPSTPGLVCLADIDYRLQGMFAAERNGEPVFVQAVLTRTAILVLDDGHRLQVPKAELFAPSEALREWTDPMRQAAARGREEAKATQKSMRGYQKNRVGLSLKGPLNG